MTATVTLAAFGCGLCAVAAVLMVVVGLRRPVPALGPAVAGLDPFPGLEYPGLEDPVVGTGAGAGVGAVGSGLRERAGGWLMRVGRLSPTAAQSAQLRLRGVSTARYYGNRLVTALLCAMNVTLLAGSGWLLGLPFSLPVPTAMVLAAAVVGWFLPALMVASTASRVTADADEALLVFIDLVVLERLANQHAKDALTNAAAVSDNPLFVQIRAALARAELERVQPWAELRRSADRLHLPQLADIADIARLQDEGGSLVGAFRARATELRNQHTVRRRMEASKITQRMVYTTTLPVIVVGAIFVGAPLLKLVFT